VLKKAWQQIRRAMALHGLERTKLGVSLALRIHFDLEHRVAGGDLECLGVVVAELRPGDILRLGTRDKRLRNLQGKLLVHEAQPGESAPMVQAQALRKGHQTGRRLLVPPTMPAGRA
jgi:hypothetical protein